MINLHIRATNTPKASSIPLSELLRVTAAPPSTDASQQARPVESPRRIRIVGRSQQSQYETPKVTSIESQPLFTSLRSMSTLSESMLRNSPTKSKPSVRFIGSKLADQGVPTFKLRVVPSNLLSLSFSFCLSLWTRVI